MALPQHFGSPDEYFEECYKFFDEYQGLYNFTNTEIIVRNVLDQIDIQGIDDINIYEEGFHLENVDVEYLQKFFEKLNRLRVFHEHFVEDVDVEEVFDVPLSPKKKHEIVYLAKEIKEPCESVGCNIVVDFGSGLGYLDQQIYATTNFKVLGIECNESHYVGAKKRQRKYHENSLEHVKYIRHTVTANSDTNIKTFLDDKFENYDGFCITGLHACADLTIDTINIFLKMADAKSLVLMPCCYHKMAVLTDGQDGGRFKNFPLSRCMMKYYEKYKGFEYMRVPFLRLGAQPPNVCDKLEDSIFNLLARAVLEKYAQQNKCKLKRNKRKAVKTRAMDNNFENYLLDACSHGFTLLQNESFCNEDKVEFNLDDLRSIWREINTKTMKKAGIFILLQNCLQPVIENLILFDRLIYLQENGVSNCRYKKIFNEFLSPRCLALFACK